MTGPRARIAGLRSSLATLLSRVVHSKLVYSTPIAFRGVLVCLVLLGIGVLPLSVLELPWFASMLSACVCLLEVLASWKVWNQVRHPEPGARPTLLAILVGILALLAADASFAVFHALGRAGDPLAVLLARLPHVVAFTCFAAAPVLFAGRRFFAIATPTHLGIAAMLLTPLWLRFVLLEAVGVVEIAVDVVELVAALVAIALVLDAIAAHFALFYAGVLSLALADWVRDARPGLFWAAAVVVTCMTLSGDARTPDLEKRADARSNAARTRRTVAKGLIVAAVVATSMLVAIVGLPKEETQLGTFLAAEMAVVVVLAVLIAGFLHPADTEQVMPSSTSSLTRASVVIITSTHDTLAATASVFRIPLAPIPPVRGRQYYMRDGAEGPIVLTRTPRLPNMDSLARIVASVSDWRPKLVIIIGTARPLRPELQNGDVVLATELVELVPPARSMLSLAIKGPLLEVVASASPWVPAGGPVGFTRPPLFHRGRIVCDRKGALSSEQDGDLRREGVLAVDLSGFGFGELAAKQLERTPTLMMCGVLPDALDRSWGLGSPEVDTLGDAVSHYLERRLGDLLKAASTIRARPTYEPLAHASVFVCHRPDDAWFAVELASRLSENGATVFLGEERIGPSGARDGASHDLQQASHVVVVGSGSLEGHPWVDVRASVRADKVILPIVLDRHARSWVNMYFSGVAFDFSAQTFVSLERSFAHLLSALRTNRLPTTRLRFQDGPPSLTRDLDALITGFCEVLHRWLAGRIHVEFIMHVLEAELDRLMAAEQREGVDAQLYEIEALLSVGEGEREGNYRAVVDGMEAVFEHIRVVKPPTADIRKMMLRRLGLELSSVLATVAHDPDGAKMLAKQAGFPPQHLPDFQTAAKFWSDVIEQALNGRCALSDLAHEAAEQFPHNEELRRLEAELPQVREP